MIVSPVTPEDTDELVRTMRRQDVEEVALMSGCTPAEIVPRSIAVSTVCYAMRIPDGPLLCIFGAAQRSPSMASIWELGTASIDRHPIQFVRACPPALQLVMDALPDVDLFFNSIPTQNRRSMRWLKTLGAVFNDPIVRPPGILVSGFAIYRKDVAHV